MELLARTTVMDGGQAMMALAAEIQKVCDRAKGIEALKPLAEKTEALMKRAGEVAMFLGKNMMTGQVENAFAFAYTFMEILGDAIMAWMLLWRASIAAELLAKGTRKKDEKFLDGQVKSAIFFIKNFLPVTNGKIDSIMDNCCAAIEIDDESFGGK